MIRTEDLYRQFGPMVLRRCRRLLGDEQAAVEAMQDSFVRILEWRQGSELHPAALGGLMIRIATQVCFNQRRHARRNPVDTLDASLLELVSTLDAEPRMLARDFVARFFGGAKGERGASDQWIAALRFVDDLGHEEIARETGMSVSGVRKRLRELQTRFEKARRREKESP